jgi:hypothetical protein
MGFDGGGFDFDGFNGSDLMAATEAAIEHATNRAADGSRGRLML